MIKIGKRQKMIINNFSSVGAYLDAQTGDTKDNILLPNNEIEGKDLNVGDEVDVLIYTDSEDRIIATLRKTQALAGTLKKLEVVDKNNGGAFLYWGLKKDLFLPESQQVCKVNIGEHHLVGIFEDSKGRLAATMKIYKFLLPCDDSFKKNDFVKGTVYNIKKDVGVYVAVENRYFGLIPKEEYFKNFRIGDEIEARIIRIREDGKIDLSPRELSHNQVKIDSEMIYEKMKLLKDNFRFNDNSSPEDITEYFEISKKAFKKAMGKLLKDRLITKTADGYFKLNK